MQNRHTLKRQILRAISQIKKVAEATGMSGTVSLYYSGIRPDEWDMILVSIDEYRMYRHYVTVTDQLQVALILN